MMLIKKIINNLLSRFMITCGWLYGFWVFRVMNHVEIIGRENVPRTKNVLYVSNHQTFIDSFLVGVSLVKLTDVILHYDLIPWNAADKKNFFDTPLLRFIFGHLKNMPTTRGQQTKETMLKQLSDCGLKLQHGTLLLFFEGTRSETDEILECKPGVAQIIYEQRPTVVPIRLINIQSIMPKELGFKFFSLHWFKRGRLIIGKPIIFNGVFRQADPRKVRKEIGKSVREAVEAIK